MQFLSPTSHISSAKKPYENSGYHVEQHKYRTFSSLQKVLLESAALGTKL